MQPCHLSPYSSIIKENDVGPNSFMDISVDLPNNKSDIDFHLLNGTKIAAQRSSVSKLKEQPDDHGKTLYYPTKKSDQFKPSVETQNLFFNMSGLRLALPKNDDKNINDNIIIQQLKESVHQDYGCDIFCDDDAVVMQDSKDPRMSVSKHNGLKKDRKGSSSSKIHKVFRFPEMPFKCCKCDFMCNHLYNFRNHKMLHLDKKSVNI